MARTVDDLALLYQIIAGPDGRDTDVQPVPVEKGPKVTLRDLRIAVAPTFADLPLASEIRMAIERLAKELAPLCAAVEETSLPALDFNQDLAKAGELISMTLGAFEEQGDGPTASLAQYLQSLHRRDHSIFTCEEFFAQWDVLLCAPTMLTAFPHCEVDGYMCR
jgi:amidase